jgi:hypothetical protein
MYIGDTPLPYIFNITKIMRMEPDFQRSRDLSGAPENEKEE